MWTESLLASVMIRAVCPADADGVEDPSGLSDSALALGAWEALGDVDEEDERALLFDVASDLGEGLREEAQRAEPVAEPRPVGERWRVEPIEEPEGIRRIPTHLKLGPFAEADRGPSSPASSSGGSPTEPHYEPLFDDLPWEEPTFEADRPPDDEPIGDSA